MYYNQSETSSEFSNAKLAICNLLKKLYNSDSFFNVSYTWYKSLIKLVLDKGLMSLARLFHFYKCIAKYHRNLEVNFWVNVRFADWNYSLELLIVYFCTTVCQKDNAVKISAILMKYPSWCNFKQRV